MIIIKKGQRFKRQGKTYEAHEDSYLHPHEKHQIVKYQAINSLTDKPWQAMRWCPTSECQSLLSINEVISELSRDQCQFLLYRIGVLFFAKEDNTLKLLVREYLNVEDLSESAIREVYENV